RPAADDPRRGLPAQSPRGVQPAAIPLRAWRTRARRRARGRGRWDAPGFSGGAEKGAFPRVAARRARRHGALWPRGRDRCRRTLGDARGQRPHRRGYGHRDQADLSRSEQRARRGDRAHGRTRLPVLARRAANEVLLPDAERRDERNGDRYGRRRGIQHQRGADAGQARARARQAAVPRRDARSPRVVGATLRGIPRHDSRRVGRRRRRRPHRNKPSGRAADARLRMPGEQPTVESLTDPFILTFTPPPVIGPGVCDVCHGSPNPGFDRCYSCAQTVAQVSRPVELVVPITLCEAMGQMHHVLRAYKDSPDESVRTRMRLRIAALLYRFLATHRACVANAAGRDWDVIATVPSSTGRAGTHPLELVIRHIPPVEQEHATLLRRGPGQLSHNRASDDGYLVTQNVSGMSVLLV